MQDRPDIFSEWEATLEEMQQTLDRIQSRREQAAQDEEDKQTDET